jgi:hypothetical protein
MRIANAIAWSLVSFVVIDAIYAAKALKALKAIKAVKGETRI